MWSEARLLSDREIQIILDASIMRWEENYLRSIMVREFDVDNALTVRNSKYIDVPLTFVLSFMSSDDDGAMVDVILYSSKDGEFGELEMNRVDSKSFILKSRIKRT